MANSGNTATTAYITGAGTVGAKLRFRWEEERQSVADNTTTIKWWLELVSYDYGYNSGSQKHEWNVNVNGTAYKGTATVGIASNATKTLASGSTTIKHENDGTKTFTYSFSQLFAITFNGKYIGTVLGTGSGKLDTIPRSSTFGTITGNTIGSSITANINRSSSSFTHQVWYRIGSSAWKDLGTGIETSITFTPDLNLCSQIPNDTKGIMELCIRTYSGTSQIGSDVYKNITVNVPASVKPSVSINVTDAAGYKDVYGAFIKGISKFNVVVNASSAYGSGIVSYSINANDAVYTDAAFTTDALKEAGVLEISATVKDKRGRSGIAKASNLLVLDYLEPVISAFKVGRCDSNGTPDDRGEFVKVTFSSHVTNLNNRNTAKYVIKYKRTSESSFPASQIKTLSAYANNYAVTDGSVILPASSSYSFDIVLEVTDAFAKTQTSAPVSTGFTLVHFGKDGRSLGIGRVTEEENMLDVDLPARFRKGVNIDSEWITISTFDDGSVIIPDSSVGAYITPLRYRKMLDRVYITGCIGLSSAYAGGPVTIATLPEGFRPVKGRAFAFTPLTGGNIGRVYVDEKGPLVLEWVRAISNGTGKTGALSWIYIDLEYFID